MSAVRARRSPQPFSWPVTVDGDRRAVLRLFGELDHGLADSVRSDIAALLEDGRVELDIDVTDVAFIDSTVLGALIGAHKGAVAASGAVRLLGVHGAVRAVLETTRLDRIIPSA